MGHIPLHVAVERDYCDIVGLLLDSGADPNRPDKVSVMECVLNVWKHFTMSMVILTIKCVLYTSTVLEITDVVYMWCMYMYCLTRVLEGLVLFELH